MSDSLRRWIDKILVGAIGLVIALMVFIWTNLNAQVTLIDNQQRSESERVRAVEVKLDVIDKRQERIEGKIDRILEKVK